MPHALRGLACRILLLVCVAYATASAAAGRLHPRRHAARQHHARAGVVGRRVLRPARAARSGRQHDPRLERHHLPGDRPVARDADRPAGAARDRQRRAGRPPAQLPARRQRVLRDGRRKQPKGTDADAHRLLPRPATRGRAARRGTAASSGRATPTAAPGSRPPARDSAPASGGPPRTPRPTSPTASGSRSPCPTRSRRSPTVGSAASSRAADGMDDLRVVRHQPDQQLRRGGLHRPVRAVHRYLRGRGRPPHARLLAARRAPRGRPRRSGSRSKPMLQCFEHWFGPYPWYRDGYQLVEAPHLGMEHQSAVAYGNGFSNGYKGRDLSGTGLGPDLGLHRGPRERPRVVRQQHHHRRRGRHVGARELRQLLGVAVHRVPVRQARRARPTSRGTRKLIKNDSADRRAVRRERRGLGRHVLQGRQHAAHDPPGHRQRQHLAGDPARAADANSAHRIVTGQAGPGLHQRARRHRPAQGLRAVSHDDQDSGVRVPPRRDDAHVSLGRRRARVRHAGPGAPVGARQRRRGSRRPSTGRPTTLPLAAPGGLPRGRELLRGSRSGSTPGRRGRRGPTGRVIGPDGAERLQPLIAGAGCGRLAAVRLPRPEPDRRRGARRRDPRAAGGCTSSFRATGPPSRAGPRGRRRALARVARRVAQARVGHARGADARSSARWCGAGGSRSTTRPTARFPISTASPPAWRSCSGGSAPRWCRRRIW